MGSFRLYLNFWGIILLELPWKYYAGSFPNGPQRLFLSSLTFFLATCGYGWSDRNSNRSNFLCLCSHLMVQGSGFPVPSNILLGISGSAQSRSCMWSQSNSAHPVRQFHEPLVITVLWQVLCCPAGHHVCYGVGWGTSPTSPASAGSTDTPDALSLSTSLGDICWALVSLSEAEQWSQRVSQPVKCLVLNQGRISLYGALCWSGSWREGGCCLWNFFFNEWFFEYLFRILKPNRCLDRKTNLTDRYYVLPRISTALIAKASFLVRSSHAWLLDLTLISLLSTHQFCSGSGHFRAHGKTDSKWLKDETKFLLPIRRSPVARELQGW